MDINGSLAGAEAATAQLLADRLHIREAIADLDGDPSPATVEELRRSFTGVRQESRRLRVLAASAAAFAAVAALAVWAAVAAVRQRDEAIRQSRVARSRELAATSAAQLVADPQRGLRLAIEAMTQTPTSEARLALIHAMVNARLRLRLTRAGAKVEAVAFSPDGQRVAIATESGAVHLYDFRTGAATLLAGHTKRVVDVEFSRDGARVATAGWDNRGALWDASTGKLITFLPHDNVVTDVAFDPRGRTLVTAGDRTPRVWDAKSGRFLFPLTGHESNSGPVAFSADGRWIATGGWEPRARLWDAETGRLLTTLTLPPYTHTSNSVTAVMFSGDGKLLLTTSDGDKTTRIWSMPDGRPLREIDSGGRVARFNPQGTLLVTIGWDGTAEVRETGTWTRVAVLTGHPGIHDAIFSANGDRIATVSNESATRIWQIVPTLTHYIAVPLVELRQPDEPINELAFSADGRALLGGGSDSAFLWDITQGTPEVSTPALGERANRLAVSADGRWLALAALKSVTVWDTRSWKQVRRFVRPEDFRGGIAFSPDGRFLAVTGVRARVWRTADWGVVDAPLEAEAPARRGVAADVAFSADGSTFALAAVGEPVTLWRVATWRRVATLPPDFLSFETVAFAPNGRTIFVGGAQTATVWELRGGRWKKTRDLTAVIGGVSAAAFAPDGSRLVTAGYGGVQMWDAVRWQPQRALRGHAESVHSAGFSPDGRWIVTSSDDRTTRVWHADTGDAVLVLDDDAQSPRTATFLPDGQTIVTAGDRGTIRVYRCEICAGDASLLRRARTRFARAVALPLSSAPNAAQPFPASTNK
ncbi:MAG: WD40 repeat domain-containing protein [Acidobacteriota bacterium]|nr:WD40 repeat domain-containing protein [Acidobacteriota bacterium]